MFYFSELLRPKPKGESGSMPSMTEASEAHPEYVSSLLFISQIS
jgi:hypothetical protein